MDLNWELCCLCQSDKNEPLQNPKEEGLLSLEKDLNDFKEIDTEPSGITVSFDQLNDGSGIAATLRAHNAKYHKICRSYCSSSRLKRLQQKQKGPSSPKKLRSGGTAHSKEHDVKCCIICNGDDKSNMRKVATDKVDTNLKKWAQSTKNFQLTGKLIAQAADAHAGDTYYHVKCYLHLRDSARTAGCQTSTGPAPAQFDPIVTAQIIALVEDSDSVFKLSALRQMYRTLMEEQGSPCHHTREPHSTRFKEHLLNLLPEWAEFAQGKEIYISNKTKVADLLAKAHDSQIGQDDALLLMRAAVLLRKLCLQKQEPFNGQFSPDCLTSSVPEELRSFINVILQGGSILRDEGNIDVDEHVHGRAKIACTISQLLIYNTYSGTHHATKTSTIRHVKEHETPFVLYQGLKMHGDARLKKQIDKSHELGLSVSYGRVMEVKQAIARAVCKRHAEDGVVLPTNLRSNVFVTYDMDNLDNRNTGNFSQDEFHGTALSATNHLSCENQGVQRAPIQLDFSDTSVPQLPDSYAIIHPVELDNSPLFAPRSINGQVRPSHDLVQGAKLKDESWMTHVTTVLQQDTLPEEEVITWSGYNSRLMGPDSLKPRAVLAVFPLFPDKAASPSMIKHAMQLTMQGTEFLNPGQTGVLGADQPIYAIAKQLQWTFPDTLGEDKLVLMMGALHIEDKAHQMIGKLLRDSGWTTTISQAQVLTSGRAQSALDENHIKRTRYAHQVSLMALHLLKHKAYSAYCSNVDGPPESQAMWDQLSRTENPQFKYWSTIMELELLICRFVRSLREGDFLLYVQVCDELCAWFHVMDHTNYARWLPVHVRDMVQLSEKHPDIHAEFMKGNFVIQKSPHKFSLIGKDQSHEQSNKSLQAHGGAVGLYENPEALTLFMLAGPDCSRCVEEFESVLQSRSPSTAHHEEARSLQVKYRKDVLSFVEIVEQLGNPFAASQELVALHTQEVMEQEVVRSLSRVHEVGEDLHAQYVAQTLDNVTQPVSNTIRRNKILTFANRPDLTKKGNKTSGVQKKNMTLITQLFLSLQSRPDADMADFFRFENQREPPSLADHGSLRSGSKSDILGCIKSPTGQAVQARSATVVVLDMAAVVHMVRPTSAKTFMEYVTQHMMPFLESQLTPTVERMDAIWDTYPQDSLKSLTHQRRGTGPRTRIGDGHTRIPKHDWNSGFLKNEDNKKEFFSFLSEEIVKSDLRGKLLLSTTLENVLTNRPCDVSALQPCNHPEADTRIFLHLAHAVAQGHKTAYIRTVDSDVVVLAVRFFSTLGLSELWVGFGSGKKFRDIPIHDICSDLGPSRCLALPLFHAITGCDTTSHFFGCGKKTAWASWNNTPGLTETLLDITNDPNLLTLESSHMQKLERFVVIMYSKGCGLAKVNEARHRLFTSGKKSLENIPPTQAALFEHLKRALLQASIWNQATSVRQEILDFSEWGWQKETGVWLPFWTTLADANKACSILLHCGCERSCTGNCKCCRGGVRCTGLCKCEGGCVNNDEV